MPKNKLFLSFCCLVIAFSFFLFTSPLYADELDDLNKQIADLTNQMNQSIAATKPLESQLKSMQQQITGIKARISDVEADIVQKKISIDTGYKNLAQKQVVLNSAIRNYYIKSYYDSPLLVFLSSKSATDVTQALAYQRATTNQEKAMITNIALSITNLEEKKAALVVEEQGLVIAKANLDTQSQKLDGIVKGAKDYQSQLSSKIASLTAQQQQFIAQKQGTLNIPVSAYTTQGGCSSDLTNGKDPGFSPRFALFSYGVPHRVGMSQYGAKGRAEAGQNAETILSAYFNADLRKDYDSGITITVNGTNEYGQSFSNQQWNIEDYVKHIYEVPASWPMETLKAQAVAARSYALATSNNGQSSICPSQSCQVVKQEENADSWKQAVDATRGWVLTSGGQPIQAWFSSTAGGYTFSSGSVWGNDKSWTKNSQDSSGGINSFSDLQNNAYDKSSPWFYCDWGGRSEYNGTAWLKSEELADIVNVILLVRKDASTSDHLYQTDKPNPKGTDTWDAGRVRQELQNRGGNPYTSVSGASLGTDFGSGKTTSITIEGSAGSQMFDGTEFKNFFNLRAPANINIVGSLFNLEKR